MRQVLFDGRRRSPDFAGSRSSTVRYTCRGEGTKNGKPREIPVSDTLAEELPRIEAAQGGERVVTMSNLLFSTPRERKRRPNGILRIVDGPMRDIRVAWETAKKRAGIDPGFHFHDLRHTFACHRKMAGTDDCTLLAIMGHSEC